MGRAKGTLQSASVARRAQVLVAPDDPALSLAAPPPAAGTTVEAPAKTPAKATGNLDRLSVGELLGLSRHVLAELKGRGVIRTGNAPAGDYAEFLVQQATAGALAPNSEPSWDVKTPDGARLQVKARVVTGRGAGERQLSIFRGWDFDASVIVLFDDDFTISRATCLPVAVVKSAGTWNEHVHGWRVIARDELLDLGEDWTAKLRRQVQ